MVEALVLLGRVLLKHDYFFTTVTPATHARVNARPGNQQAATLEDVFGWSRTAPSGVLPPDVFQAGRAAGVLVEDGSGWRSRLRASILNEQLFFHSAYPTDEAGSVFFGPDTYRFAAAIDAHLGGDQRIERAVDIGCGAGPGAIVVARRRPHAEVLAVDINDEALRLTAVNAVLAATPRVRPQWSNLLSTVNCQLDLIVANPPYLLDAGERAYRHGGGGLGEGLSLAIAELACTRLTRGGTLLLYTGSAIVRGVDRFRMMAVPLLEAAHLEVVYREIDPDVFGEELLEPAYAEADRIAAVLVTARRP